MLKSTFSITKVSKKNILKISKLYNFLYQLLEDMLYYKDIVVIIDMHREYEFVSRKLYDDISSMLITSGIIDLSATTALNNLDDMIKEKVRAHPLTKKHGCRIKLSVLKDFTTNNKEIHYLKSTLNTLIILLDKISNESYNITEIDMIEMNATYNTAKAYKRKLQNWVDHSRFTTQYVR